ncbi:MAG: hypothetical protein EXX96DRAFT_579003 [Benjaminiella poitrasii]|nr:MAG: hypothetical protein EXX96DRAFT_579003 [Benjaminiella poitrasii]
MMLSSFKFVSKPGKKISLERTSHPCPKCKHHASVQLIRSEKRLILFNKCVSSIIRVRYECSQCTWRNEELPLRSSEMDYIINEGRFIDYYEELVIPTDSKRGKPNSLQSATFQL